MTQQTIYRQPVKLVWEKEGENNFSAKPYSLFPTRCNYQVVKLLNSWKAKLRGNGTPINKMDISHPSDIINLGSYKSKEQAQAACQADYDQRWTEGSEPAPFWKPIEQCPKVSLVNYLLHNNKTGALSIGYWNGDSWSGVCSLKHDVTRGMTAPTHYAEIPAEEESYNP